MHASDALTMLQLLVLNIYTRVMLDNIVLIIFGLRMDKICQIFFCQICFCSEFAKFSHYQSFPPYGMYIIKYGSTYLIAGIDTKNMAFTDFHNIPYSKFYLRKPIGYALLALYVPL